MVWPVAPPLWGGVGVKPDTPQGVWGFWVVGEKWGRGSWQGRPT